jgi:Na+-driven multidrug efflux pump
VNTAKIKIIISLAKQALKGGEHDYTSGSINRAIFLLAVPMIAEMIMESLFAVVDVFFVSKVSVNAVATVGLTESVLFIIYSIAVGFSMAVTAFVARRVGEKEFKRAGDAAFQAIFLAIVVSVILGLAGFIYAEDVLRVKTIVEMIKVSAGGISQFLIESASWIFLVRVISTFGSEALAGYTIAFRVIVFTLLPSWGMANAAATLVGQNLGAKQPERAATSVWRTAKYNALFLVTVSLIFFLFAQPILSFFTDEPEVKRIGISALEIICLGYIFFSYGMVISQAFNGAGDTRTPMWISLVVFWFIQIPLAYWLSIELNWQSNGVFYSIAIAHSLYAIVSILLFRKGKWKLIQV